MEEIRAYVRREPPPADTVVAIRGGNDNVERLRRHAERTRRAYAMDGKPLCGLSAYCVPPETVNELLETRLAMYPRIRLTTVGRLWAAGFPVLPTFARPHFTIVLANTRTPELTRLLACFNRPSENPRRQSQWSQA